MTMNAIAIAIGAVSSFGNGVPQPSFSALFSDAGAGAVNLGLGFGSGSATFARATSATCWGSTGLLLTVGTGVARSNYTELTGAVYLGYLAEEARTNNLLFCRDFTNAAWVKTTMTAALDQTGIDGSANSASSLLATGANATAAQTITLAAVNRPLSFYVSQLVGSGGVDLAQDGATFTHFPLTGTKTRITLVASQLNPTITVRIPVNGDKVFIDYGGLEDSGGAARTFPLSPIATTTVAVTRNADNLSYPFAGNASATAGTIYSEAIQTFTANQPATAMIVSFAAAANGEVHEIQNAQTQTTQTFRDGTNIVQATGLTNISSAVCKNAVAYGGASVAQTRNAAAVQTGSFVGTVGSTTISIGGIAGTSLWNGAIKNVKIWNTALSNALLVQITT